MIPVAPTPPRQRLLTLDVLRGFALLGILVINIRYFAGPITWLNDPAQPSGTLADLDFWTWFGGTLLFEEKMIALFSMLFGAGLVLTAGRKLALHLSRHGWLLAIGAAHAFLLWHGDVLMIYAVAGVLLTPLRRASTAVLLPLGILCVLTAIGSRAWEPLSAPLGPPLLSSANAEANADATPSAQQQAFQRLFAEETEVHQGGYLGLFRWRAELNLWWHFYGGLFNLLRCGGFMLIGMALTRVGVLTGRRGPAAEWALLWSGLLIGLALTLAGMQPHLQSITGGADGPAPAPQARVLGFVLMQSAAGFVTLGWVGLWLLLCRLPAAFVMLRPLVAVGRAALSNYLAATVVCVLVFDGWGLGHFGEWSPWRAFRLVLWIWAGQLAVSTIWLSVFRFGPAEWLWRSLTFLSRQPMFRSDEAQSPAAGPALAPAITPTLPTHAPAEASPATLPDVPLIEEAPPVKPKRRFFRRRKTQRSVASTQPVTVRTTSEEHAASLDDPDQTAETPSRKEDPTTDRNDEDCRE